MNTRLIRDIILFTAVLLGCYATAVHRGYAAQIINQCSDTSGICTQIIIPDNPDTDGEQKTVEA